MARIVADKRSSATIRVIGVIRVPICWSFVEEAPADLREVFTQSLARDDHSYRKSGRSRKNSNAAGFASASTFFTGRP
jgi:hypothetical protein